MGTLERLVPLPFLFLERPAAKPEGAETTGISTPTGSGYPPDDDPDD